MARIELHGMFYDIRNKVGNLVYSKWRGINYVRQLVIPFNPNSILQQDVRHAFSRCVHAWQLFNIALKNAWAFVAVDQPYSGYNRYMGINAVTEASQGIQELSPATDVLPLTTFTAGSGAGAGEINITFSPSPIAAGMRLDVYVLKVMTDADSTQPLEYFTYPAGQTTPKTIVTTLPTLTPTHIYGVLTSLTDNRSSQDMGLAVTTG